MILDSKLNFEVYLRIASNVNKSIGLLHKLQKTLPRQSLLTIYQLLLTFIRTHLDYCEALFDQSYNDSFHQKLKSFQYKTALAITVVIYGNLKGELLSELGLESLQNLCCYRKLVIQKY